ncbi:MAG: TetR/AcrR family transcriptional regulator [Deltaproteobacteria bacterium]|nr:TetR/AcrR family transcriptional regulator [Deltaproteobacteria bacterium]
MRECIRLGVRGVPRQSGEGKLYLKYTIASASAHSSTRETDDGIEMTRDADLAEGFFSITHGNLIDKEMNTSMAGQEKKTGTLIASCLSRLGQRGATMEYSREDEFESKREEICYKAADIFAEKGFEKTTMDDISSELEMTKYGLYRYFKGKDDILFHCMLKAHTLAGEALAKIVDRKGLPPKEKLRLAIREHVKVLTTKFVYSALRQQELMLPEKFRDEVRQERRIFQQMFASIIQEGIEQGCFRTANLKLVTFAILGSANWVARWYSPDGPFTPDEISETFCQLIFKGIEK